MAEVIEYKVGDLVSLQEGQKGKIVQIVKPLGTYSMYKVQSLFDGCIKTLAKHQLVKFEPLETNDVNDMHVLEEVQPQIDPVLLSLFETEIDNITMMISTIKKLAPMTPQNNIMFPPQMSTQDVSYK